MTDEDIEARKALFKEWVIESDDLLGAEVRIARRSVDGKWLDAIAVLDVFDRNKDGLDLRFFRVSLQAIIGLQYRRHGLGVTTLSSSQTLQEQNNGNSLKHNY